MGVNRQYAKEAFARYTNEYKADDSRALLKIKHTYKVAQYCEEIAKNLCFSKDDVDVAWLVGLLHDVGRFEQLRRYGTFNDQKSVDHWACPGVWCFSPMPRRASVRSAAEAG